MSWRKTWRKRKRQLSSSYYYNSSRRKPSGAKFFSNITVLIFIGILGLVLFTGAVFAWYAKDLPSPDKVVRKEGFATKIYDRNEKLLYDVFSNQRRTPINFSDAPLYLREATVAIEDKDFYKHGGFDPRGILRAVFNIIVHRSLQGGSTLTQQLAKNVLLSPERTVTRKIKEFILAIEIERKYNKDEILQMYLNEAPYGGTAWGVEAASEVYFGKKVSELNLVESAVLAGLPQRPSVYSPFSDSQAYKGRTQQVLRRMREDGYITKDQEEQAKKDLEDIKFVSGGSSFGAPHFVMYIKKLLEDQYGANMVEQGGLKVITTLDADLQDKAQQAVSEEIAKVEGLHITNGAALVIDPKTGQILAMVGSKNYNDPNYDGKVNVTLSRRQPGSAIKPVTYVTAFKKGYTPATLLMDTPTIFPGGVGQPDYQPTNYDGKFHGPLQVRYALGSSINVTAVKMLAMVGMKEMMKTAYDMGFTTLEPTQENLTRFGLSVTLGGGEVRLLDMVSAYSAFANTGYRVEPVPILKVTDKDGKVLQEYKQTNPRRVITEEQAFLISNILSDNSARLITFGERSALNISGVNIAVKTGTTNDKKDNWTVGWTPSVVVGVWVGNNDNTSMKEVSSGVSGAAPIWRRIVLAAVQGKSSESFAVPSGVVTAEVDTVSGFRAHDGYSSRVEYFIKGTEPTGDDPVHAKLKLCKSNGSLATAVDIARGDYDEKEYFVFKENDPIDAPGTENRWQTGINQWLATQTDSRYHPPSQYCDGSQNQVDVSFRDPQDQSQVGSSFKVKVNPVSDNDINSVEIFINDEKRTSLTSAPYEQTFNLSDGVYTIKAWAIDTKGNTGDRSIKIGVNVPWDWSSSPTPTP